MLLYHIFLRPEHIYKIQTYHLSLLFHILSQQQFSSLNFEIGCKSFLVEYALNRELFYMKKIIGRRLKKFENPWCKG
jgi:hypothetical protein